MVLPKEATGLRSIAVGRSDLLKIDPRKLNVKTGWNGRDETSVENQQYLEELVESIIKNGVIQPVTCVWENGKPWVTDGHMRLKATMTAISRGHEIATIYVRPEERLNNDADRVCLQVVRNSGKPFTQMEQAGIFKRLIDYGWSTTKIADKSGVSVSRVSQTLNLLALPEEVKNMVNSGQVSATLARRTMASCGENGDVVQVLQDGIEVARKKGKKKVTAKHLNGGEDENQIIDGIPIDEEEANAVLEADSKKKTRKSNPEIDFQVVAELMGDAKIDQECSDEQGREVVVITMLADKFEVIRQILKL